VSASLTVNVACFIRQRASLLMRLHGARMVEAERSFNLWLNTFDSDHEAHYQRYLWASGRAALASARHASLIRRAQGVWS